MQSVKLLKYILEVLFKIFTLLMEKLTMNNATLWCPN